MEVDMNAIEMTTDHNEPKKSSLNLRKAKMFTTNEEGVLQEPARGARAAGDTSAAYSRGKTARESGAVTPKSSKPTRENLPRAAKTKGNVFIKKAINILGLNKYDKKHSRSKSIRVKRRRARRTGKTISSRANSISYCSVCFSNNIYKTKICSSYGKHFG